MFLLQSNNIYFNFSLLRVHPRESDCHLCRLIVPPQRNRGIVLFHLSKHELGAGGILFYKLIL